MRIGVVILIPLAVKDSSITNNGGWKWPRERNGVTQEISHHTPAHVMPDTLKEDRAVWLPANNGEYSIKRAWEVNRKPTISEKKWYSIGWFTRQVPYALNINGNDRLAGSGLLGNFL